MGKNRKPQPDPPAIFGQIGYDKAGIVPLGKISAFAMTPRALLQLISVEYSNSAKLRHGLWSLPSLIA
jgi:hypothetical protein